jgi:hypothetical protein
LKRLWLWDLESKLLLVNVERVVVVVMMMDVTVGDEVVADETSVGVS